ncbi:MAG: hypothetical protein V3V10_11375 [Planctomycetota bacterium]
MLGVQVSIKAGLTSIKDAVVEAKSALKARKQAAAKLPRIIKDNWQLVEGAGGIASFTSDLVVMDGGKTAKGIRLFVEYALVVRRNTGDKKYKLPPIDVNDMRIVSKLVVGVNLTNRDALPVSKPKASKPKEDKKDGGIVITPSEIKIGIKGDVKKDED